MYNRLFTFIEGGVVGAALVIIFNNRIIEKINEKEPHYTTYYRPYYIPSWRIKNGDEIIFNKFGDADYVLAYCRESIDKYGFCSKTLLKNYVKDVTGNEVPRKYTDYKLGWKSLDEVKIKKNHKGYYIDFPVPEELD